MAGKKETSEQSNLERGHIADRLRTITVAVIGILDYLTHLVTPRDIGSGDVTVACGHGTFSMFYGNTA